MVVRGVVVVVVGGGGSLSVGVRRQPEFCRTGLQEEMGRDGMGSGERNVGRWRLFTAAADELLRGWPCIGIPPKQDKCGGLIQFVCAGRRTIRQARSRGPKSEAARRIVQGGLWMMMMGARVNPCWPFSLI